MTYSKTYRCGNDCEPSGCPYHIGTLRYQHSTDSYFFNLNGRELFFESGEMEAVLDLLQQVHNSPLLCRISTKD